MGFNLLERPGAPRPVATLYVGVVKAVSATVGVVDVEVAGTLVRDIPYAAGLAPVVDKPVWVAAQGPWMAVLGAAHLTGQVDVSPVLWQDFPRPA